MAERGKGIQERSGVIVLTGDAGARFFESRIISIEKG